MRPILALGVTVLLLAGCGVPSGPTSPAGEPSHSLQESPRSSPTARDADGCPLTIPPDPAFVPPAPYPPQPPDLYQAAWYGSKELWTMLDPHGEIWESLPGHDGRFTQKTFWWSERNSAEGRSRLTVSGRRLDAPGAFETSGSGGGGFRADIGSFMLIGIGIPAGCWELTATYRGVALSYVVLVTG